METYHDVMRIVIQGTVTDTDETAFFDDFDKARTHDERGSGADDTEEVPATSEADSFLETGGAHVAYGGGAGVREKENGDRGLLERQHEADVWVEGGEDEVALAHFVVDFLEDRVDEGV